MELDDLLKLHANELDDLFKKSPPGPIPSGPAHGRAIIAPGTSLSPALAEFIQFFVWKGKVFDPEHGVLRNEILPLGVRAIIAQVGPGKSWFDGNDCIVLDYSKTSMVAKWIRDEIRMVEPRLYLGLVYWNDTKLIHFALRFDS